MVGRRKGRDSMIVITLTYVSRHWAVGFFVVDMLICELYESYLNIMDCLPCRTFGPIIKFTTKYIHTYNFSDGALGCDSVKC
jgi:hypothetical protein